MKKILPMVAVAWSVAGGCLAAGVAAADAAPAAVSPAVSSARGHGIQFNFDNADIRLLARMVSEVTGRRVVLGDKVEGKITILSPVPVPADEVFPFFVSVMESRGFAVLERNGTAFVMPLAETPPGAMAPPPGEAGAGLQSRIFQMLHADAVDFAKTIEPLVRGGKTGAVTAFAGSNQVLVTDMAENLRRIEAIVAEVDKPGSARSIEVVALKHASAEELAREVSVALAGSERAGANVARHISQVAEGGAAQPVDSFLIASPQSNSLVLVGTSVQREEMKRVIQMLDIEGDTGHGRLHAIFLRYLPVEEASKALNALLAKTAEKDQRQRIAIEANISNNALLVDAAPRDFQWVSELVTQLDQMPQQVMVEVVIAEVDVGKQLDLGVDWSSVDTPGSGETTVIGRSRPDVTDTILKTVTEGVFPQGLSVGVAKGTFADGSPKVAFMLQMLQQDRDVKILSSVPLWAQNNAEATVSVVENIPVLRSTIEGGSGTARDVIQNIDRIDVGIKLKLTPHVTPQGDVTLNLNPSIEAVVDPGSDTTQYTPTIAKREVKTTVTVPDQSTVVISGLIREDHVKRVRKVPLLGDIPYLGALFRYTSDQKRRNNLLVFVTPRIIKGSEDRNAVRKALETHTQLPGSPLIVNSTNSVPVAAVVPKKAKD